MEHDRVSRKRHTCIQSFDFQKRCQSNLLWKHNKTVFNKWCCVNQEIYILKKNHGVFLTPYRKIKSSQMTDLKVKTKIIVSRRKTQENTLACWAQENAFWLGHRQPLPQKIINQNSSKLKFSAQQKTFFKSKLREFLGGAVVNSLSANTGDAGSSPCPGKSHMPRSN